MTRGHDWPGRMLEAIAARREAAFSWGGNDCALFACDVAQAVCGIDFAAPFRGRYTTERGAAVVLKRFLDSKRGARPAGPTPGPGGLEAAAQKIAADHGCPEVAPLTARRGDIVLMDSDRGPVLGICVGAVVAKAGAEGGIEYVALSLARRAWRLP